MILVLLVISILPILAQSEAKMSLKQIYTMQKAYKAEKGIYWITSTAADSVNTSAFVSIRVEIARSARYAYILTSSDAGLNTFTATATATGLDYDATSDVWRIDQNGVLQIISDDSEY